MIEGIPKIESTPKEAKESQPLELVCQVRNLPSRFELNWYLNDRKLTPPTTLVGDNDETDDNDEEEETSDNEIETNYVLVSTSTAAAAAARRRQASSNQRPQRPQQQKRPSNLSLPRQYTIDGGTYEAVLERVNNVTASRLRIKRLEWFHRGVYKCKYDQVEAFYNLEFESNCQFYYKYHYINKHIIFLKSLENKSITS